MEYPRFQNPQSGQNFVFTKGDELIGRVGRIHLEESSGISIDVEIIDYSDEKDNWLVRPLSGDGIIVAGNVFPRT